MEASLQQKKGFTLIEVVLVLAIAGLIFLIVFLALPALQRSQRDTQRKQDQSRFMSQLIQYSSNRNGNLPTDATLDDFVSGYLTNSGQTFNDPTTGSTYQVEFRGTNRSDKPARAGDLFYYTNSRCDGNGTVVEANGARNIATALFAEQGEYTCQSNNQ